MPRKASGSLFQQRHLGPSRRWQRSNPPGLCMCSRLLECTLSPPASTPTSLYPSGKLPPAFQGLLRDLPPRPLFPSSTIPCVPCTQAGGWCQASCSQRHIPGHQHMQGTRGWPHFQETKEWVADWMGSSRWPCGSPWDYQPLGLPTTEAENPAQRGPVIPPCPALLIPPIFSPACLLNHTVSYLQERPPPPGHRFSVDSINRAAMWHNCEGIHSSRRFRIGALSLCCPPR